MVAPVALFVRVLGVVYVGAFVSLAVQMPGLFGSHGILPVADYLAAVRDAVVTQQLHRSPFMLMPSVFWLDASDRALTVVPWVGAAAGTLTALGVLQGPLLLVAWLLFLSICSVGQTFLGFQWDALLLESGFLAIFLVPWRWLTGWRDAPAPRRVVVWLLRFLLFRLMFASGAVKLSSGDPTWHELRALEFHYETQPIPTWTSFFAHQLPSWFQHASCFVMFVIELVLPFGIFLPRPARLVSFVGLLMLQVLIGSTGNYGYFNLLTAALCLLLLDDACFPARLRLTASEPATPPWQTIGAWGVGALWLAVSVNALMPAFGWRRQPPAAVRWLQAVVQPIDEVLHPLDVVHSYGLFASMTTERPEIMVEGSADGTTWKRYGFKYKAGDLRRGPVFAGLHMPRLDWQMWFAALGSWQRNQWFGAFEQHLLEGTPEVLALIADNPFPDAPPKYVRAQMYDYHFTDLAHWRETGEWWRATYKGGYGPVLSREANIDNQ